MILYHATGPENVESILCEGLRPNGMGIVYLSPMPMTCFGSEVLEVETGNLRLTAFDDCKDWEVLCWGHVPPENIKIWDRSSMDKLEGEIQMDE